MATKRVHSPELVANPFIKKRNLEWSLDTTTTAQNKAGHDSSGDDEPGRSRPRRDPGPAAGAPPPPPTASAVEAGRAQVDDHAAYFGGLLARARLSPFPPGAPRLAVARYAALYAANCLGNSARGAHFVVHQHDHPVAGTHYDLRLQINATSSASWALMYGLPGDSNSARLNRNATETRVHCLWNHLVETASHATGSLLIWDTGTYSVLPPPESSTTIATSSQSPSRDDDDDDDDDDDRSAGPTEQEKLAAAFTSRRIRVELRGARLPRPYVLNLRLPRVEDAAGRERAAARASSGNSDPSLRSDQDHDDDETVHAPVQDATAADAGDVSAMERELRELEDAEVRRTNAYPGATNTIGSIHQRRWYASLDRAASGFVRRRRDDGRVVWEQPDGPATRIENGGNDEKEEEEDGGAGRLRYPFHVRGVDAERSVVTGRLGADVLRDEGVEGYVGRRGWLPVLR
ncbi:DNA polymerase ligase-domain-containing protein [Xylariaceae sp. FL0804]|nr:DNA polymerase ligase-domain-containing protein [Xylariaceae sp. FL0804]